LKKVVKMGVANPDFVKKLEKLGFPSVTICFNCGNCSAICPLFNGLPGKIIRYIQLGMEDRILANPKELWLCLHCGLCTETCPRKVDPGEVIHGLKQYVISRWRGEI